jgi:hypothetical protein
VVIVSVVILALACAAGGYLLHRAMQGGEPESAVEDRTPLPPPDRTETPAK